MKRILVCMLLVAAATLTGAEGGTPSQKIVVIPLRNCYNVLNCCKTCLTFPFFIPCFTLCWGDPGGKVVNVDCPWSRSATGLAFRYRHYAVDYGDQRGQGGPAGGCAPCGASGGSAAASPIGNLSFERFFIVDTDISSSLGRNWVSNWDIWLDCFAPGTIAGGRPTGQPGWQVLLSQPQRQPVDFLVCVDPGGTRVYRSHEANPLEGVRFYDAANAQVATPDLAAWAESTSWQRTVYRFEMYRETPTGNPRGRLVSVTDANGNVTTVTWAYRTDDPAMTGSMRSKLRIRSRITDASERSLSFVYDESRTYDGNWLTTDVVFPDGRSTHYRYGQLAGAWWSSYTNLVGVDHPDGSVSSFSATLDPALSCVRWSCSDPAAEATSRNKTVWYTTAPWKDPANPSHQVGQIFGRVRQIADGNGDIVFQGWFGDVKQADGTREDRSIWYEEGRWRGAVHRSGGTPTAEYLWTGDGAPDVEAQGWNGWVLTGGLGYATGSWFSNQATTPGGKHVVTERDPVSQLPIRETHEDGSVAAWRYDAWGRVLVERDRIGRLTEHSYDDAGNRLSTTRGWLSPDPLDLDKREIPPGGVLATERWSYWTAADAGSPGAGRPGQLRSRTDANGNVTQYAYTPAGDLETITSPRDDAASIPLVETRTYEVDSGRVHSVAKTGGQKATYTYDARGRVTAIAYADGTGESSAYAISGPGAGLLEREVDRNKRVTVHGWDAAGRQILTQRQVSAADPTVVMRHEQVWIPGTRRLAAELRDGERTTYGYDAWLRRNAITRQVDGTHALTEQMRFDVEGREVERTDAFGRRTFQAYDPDGHVVRVVRERLPGGLPAGADPATAGRIGGDDPSYIIEDIVYDAVGQVTERTDARGYLSTFRYDAHGRMREQTEAVGTAVAATTRHAYDPAGNRTATTSPRGVITAMGYTGRNQLASVTEAAGTAEATVVRRLSYTPTGKLASETDANGHTTVYLYGGCCDRLLRVRDAALVETTFQYDSIGNRTAVTQPLTTTASATTTTGYDARDRVERVTDPLNRSTRMVYDEDLRDGAGLDADPLVRAVADSCGWTRRTAPDDVGSDGSAVQSVDPLGARTTELRDALGRVVARIDALGHVTRLSYDNLTADSLVEQTTVLPLGRTLRQRVDGLGRVIASIDAAGQTTTSRFDAAGNQTAALQRVPHAGAADEVIGWTASYDARGRLLARSDTRAAGPGTTSWGYDLDGNRVTETDASLAVETSVYDLRNRRIELRDRVGGTTSFGYDAVGNLVSISDADNAVRPAAQRATGLTQYAYDVRNLLVAEVFPAGQRGRTLRRYDYDLGRRLVSRQVGILAGAFGATAGFAGAAEPTGYQYDLASRLTVRRYADGRDDGFDYDATGRLILATSARYGNQVSRGYDTAGRLTGEVLTIAAGTGVRGRVLLPAQYAVGYSHDDANRVTAITYPDGRALTWDYTSRDQLQTVGFAGETVAKRGYDAAGRLITTDYANGLTETRRYVPGDHLVGGMRTAATGAPDGPAVVGFGYSYDADRRKLTEIDEVRPDASQRFAYDDAGRLIDWQRGAARQRWDLSLVGDWRSTTVDGVVQARTSNAVHEVTRVGRDALAYDAKGNLTRDDRDQTLVWDAENRLAEARRLVESDPSVATYAYDALGRRIAKTVDGIRTDYVCAGAQVVQTYAVRATVRPADLRSDGTNGNLGLTPAGGGILPAIAGKPTLRINMQPAYEPIPAGYLADKGRPLGVRSNGRIYGWTTDRSAEAAVRGVVADAAWDTLIPMDAASWRIALANGSYTVAIVAGDAANTDSVNNLSVNGVPLSDDPEIPPPSQPGYATGDFDAWVVQATVSDGYLTIAARTGAIRPKLCLVEIGPRNVVTNPATVAPALAARVAAMTTATAGGGNAALARQPTSYVTTPTYVDEVLAHVAGRGPQAQRLYVMANHLYSVAVLTGPKKADGTVDVVERYQYDAYGTQKITDGSGNVTRAKSSVGWDRGFTGYVADIETGLLHARARQYSPTLGRFVGRDGYMQSVGFQFEQPSPRRAILALYPNGRPRVGGNYVDGFGLYVALFAMRPGLDPSGNPWSVNDGTNTFTNDPPVPGANKPPALSFYTNTDAEDVFGRSNSLSIYLPPGYCCCESVYWRQYVTTSREIDWYPDDTGSWHLDGGTKYPFQDPTRPANGDFTGYNVTGMTDDPGAGTARLVKLTQDFVAQAICVKKGKEYILAQVSYGHTITKTATVTRGPNIIWYGCDQETTSGTSFGHDLLPPPPPSPAPAPGGGGGGMLPFTPGGGWPANGWK